MPYSDATYSEVALWTESTQILYEPGGKRAGSKAAKRYNRYSKAKTLAEALLLGATPGDVLNDVERRLVKRTGGPVRDRPLDILQVEDPTSLTQTDLVLSRMVDGKRLRTEQNGEGQGDVQEHRAAVKRARLSAEFGVKADQLAEGTSWAESLSMVASRSRANVEAQGILQAAKDEGRNVTEDEVLRVLRLWAIKRNGDRKVVLPDGRKWVHSENVGLMCCSGARLIATLHCRQYPFVMMLFVQWMKERMPSFQFSSIFVNSAYSARRHRDSMTAGPTMIKAFGEFEGGRLRYWPRDDRKARISTLRQEDAMVLDVHSAPYLIDGNRAHEVEPFVGEERYSLVFFTPRLYARTAPEVQEQLAALGFPFPSEAGLDHLRTVMLTPKALRHHLAVKGGEVGEAAAEAEIADKEQSAAEAMLLDPLALELDAAVAAIFAPQAPEAEQDAARAGGAAEVAGAGGGRAAVGAEVEMVAAGREEQAGEDAEGGSEKAAAGAEWAGAYAAEREGAAAGEEQAPPAAADADQAAEAPQAGEPAGGAEDAGEAVSSPWRLRLGAWTSRVLSRARGAAAQARP